jgi:hypothetical protein
MVDVNFVRQVCWSYSVRTSPQFKELAQEAFRNRFNMKLDFIKEKELSGRR